jgi:hypothetical protein
MALGITSPTKTIITRSRLSIANPNGVVEPLWLQGSRDHLDFTLKP